MITLTNTAFLFPGQGSQFIGMGSDLAREYPEAEHVFRQADEILGFPLSQIAWEGPEDELNDTINTQPALLVHSIAALHVFKNQYPGFTPSYVAGHSMGEISALVAAGALPFTDALHLVRRRGELMKQAGDLSPGGMAAIIGLDIHTLENICLQASAVDDIVQVANDNCPGQVVISGADPALIRAMELAKESKARRVVRLAVSIAAHSPLMQHAQEEFNHAVDLAPVIKPITPIIGNVSASPMNDADQIRSDLQAQLTSRVRWTESIEYLISKGVTTFIEMGSGSVLTGLLRRIHRPAVGVTFGVTKDVLQLQDRFI
jgi:[acyl-carrier-protein] S-malonyltransferase